MTTLTAARTAIRVRGLIKSFGHGRGHTVALGGLDLDVAEGQFLCLLGRSGCGKSTLLNVLAQLDEPTAGSVDLGGRKVAMMFQDATLFPWLTAGGNIALALRLAGVPRSQRSARVAELLELAHLGGLQQKRPHELSGGMRQRVALVRALAQDASVLLMDEPFGALDAMTRDVLHDELERIWRERRLTVVFVTHNVREAVRLGDRVLLMAPSPGRVDAELDVDVPRPRRIDSPEVGERARRLTDQLQAQGSMT
ncbi:MAG: ABC transporter ATP-binding protein [Jiangellaceae bacterium]|nr:ABC transporter ATP-binding protein [Jiangellaceae bacterium]